ncbi:hypothetical protein BRD04_00525 [Halobacteriales archaeon QS_9_67_17]|nr:MAG: hypothetical protein BRD04_00525 [Halobacteriales archaeon QS_9_67_17]
MRVAAGTRGRVPNATGYIVASDAVLARTAIADAERVADTLDARNVSYDRAAVAAQLAAARAARDRGDRLRGQAPGAVKQYRIAWAHAQRALDIMDEAVTPTVSIDTRRDRPHNESLTHPLNGTVFDVRGYELTATLSVNDTTKRTVAVNASTVPGDLARFNTSQELARQWPAFNRSSFVNRTYVLTITATDSGRDYAPTALAKFDEIHDRQRGANPLQLDGDGLPDRYEMRVTETNPLDPDSDAARTARSESRNATIDGNEDFDGDGLTTYREYRQSLAPLDSDTDNDTLEDGFETRYRPLAPTQSDTDGDGVPDAKEDTDDDGLATGREQTLGSNPVVADTDDDELADDEIDRYDTSPTATDTDGDGLTDYEEVELDTDPLVADSDGDGSVDGNETYSTTATNVSTGVSVTVRTDGLGSDQVEVRSQPSYFDNGETRAGPTVQITNRTAVENATVRIPITESVSNQESLSIYTWDPQLTRRGSRSRRGSTPRTALQSRP